MESATTKRVSSDIDIPRQPKRQRTSLCRCVHIAPNTCTTCAKIARKIHRLYGKRLALSNEELKHKAPPEPPNQEAMLVLADQPCDCLELRSDDCSTCAAFAIKMGMFVNIYSKSDRGEEEEEDEGAPKYRPGCDCVYLSNMGCESCRRIIQRLETTFSKRVYLQSDTPLVSTSPLPGQSSSQSTTTAISLTSKPTPLSTSTTTPYLSQFVALDCEMVGVMDYTQRNAKGKPKMVSALARCSVVDAGCKVLLDIYVRPDSRVADYRTKYSGIRKSDMMHAVSTSSARTTIINTLKDKIVIGHSIHNDFAAIQYTPGRGRYRDIGKCRLLRDMYLRKTRISGPGNNCIGLKKLSAALLRSRIQQGSHCSVEDAKHTMKLYLLVRDPWESNINTGQDVASDSVRDEESGSKSDNEVYLGDTFWAHPTSEN